MTFKESSPDTLSDQDAVAIAKSWMAKSLSPDSSKNEPSVVDAMIGNSESTEQRLVYKMVAFHQTVAGLPLLDGAGEVNVKIANNRSIIEATDGRFQFEQSNSTGEIADTDFQTVIKLAEESFDKEVAERFPAAKFKTTSDDISAGYELDKASGTAELVVRKIVTVEGGMFTKPYQLQRKAKDLLK
jgi:hypothetical protein